MAFDPAIEARCRILGMSLKRPIVPLCTLFVIGCGQQEPASAPPAAVQKEEAAVGEIVKLDPGMDEIAPALARIEKLGGGFQFTEGPLWFKEGYLLFSDIPANVIRKWTPDGQVAVFREKSGYEGTDAPAGAFIGSNGLTLDSQGRLIICEHANGRVTRLEKDGKLTVLAAKFQGRRLNSPNDAVYKSDGSLYFTDPPYGFVLEDKDPKKELKFNGVYRLRGERLDLLVKDMTRPNGLAFSPDEKVLYIANSDPARKVWMRFDVASDGKLANGKVFFDATKEAADGLPDGMKVDQKGNVYGTGPGGVWVFSPEGKHLGTIKPPETPANCAWGDADGKTLYMTARTGLYRVKLGIAGIRP
jgi:gluconolactonase